MQLTELVEDLQRDFPAPLEETILRSVRRAFRQLCVEGECWTLSVEAALEQGDNIVLLPVPFDTYAGTLRGVEFQPNGAQDYHTLHIARMRDVTLSTTGSPRRCYLHDNAVYVDNAGKRGNIRASVTLFPTRTIEEIDDEIGDKFWEVIRAGACYYLLTTPGIEVESTIDEKNRHYMEFKDGIRAARREVKKTRSTPSGTAAYGGIRW